MDQKNHRKEESYPHNILVQYLLDLSYKIVKPKMIIIMNHIVNWILQNQK